MTTDSRPTVAIIGASTEHRKFGNKAVRAFRDAGWQVFPVNLHADRVEGLAAAHRVGDVSVALDRVSIYLHPADTYSVLNDVAAVHPGEVWLNPGSDDARVVERCQELGLKTRRGCSIVDIGMSPADYP
jgi:predicted CoA-binding protein